MVSGGASDMCMCKKCGKMMGGLVLILGVLFLLRDLKVWEFWNIQWWTAVFILGGFGLLCTRCCPDCQACSCCAADEGSKAEKPKK